jgi:hypothetical protein
MDHPGACHPEAPFFGAEGPMQFAGVANAADKSMGPSRAQNAGLRMTTLRKEKGTAEAVP